MSQAAAKQPFGECRGGQAEGCDRHAAGRKWHPATVMSWQRHNPASEPPGTMGRQPGNEGQMKEPKRDSRFTIDTDTDFDHKDHDHMGHIHTGRTRILQEPAEGTFREGKLSYSAISLQGTRNRQEDSLLCGRRDDRLIAVVCDGIGGMDNGHIASRTVADLLFADLGKVPVMGEEGMHAFFQREMERLDDAVFGLRDPSGRRMNAGTTVVAALVCGGWLHWFSMGDSRLYLLQGRRQQNQGLRCLEQQDRDSRSQGLYCLTTDHNYGAVLEARRRAGTIGQAQYRQESGKREWLTSYLGMGIAEQFDYGRIPFTGDAGEKLLLCSDGLYKTVSQEELQEILRKPTSINAISRQLQEAVLRKNDPAQDNASWIVVGREEM